MAESADKIARDAQIAARVQPDVGVEQIGTIYGKALLGATENAGQTVAVLEELDAIVDDLFRQFPRLEEVLSSMLISPDEKSGVLDRVLATRVSPLTLAFLKVVSRHGRLDCLRSIHRQARVLYDKMRGAVRVRVTTATPLDKALREKIIADLRATLGQEPILEPIVDPDLIGGAVLRVGDTVYDGSITNQLKVVRQQMIDRSVHEIQSRRDRFRNSTGS